MLGFFDDVKITSSYKKESKQYGKIKSRLTHGFIFKIKGSTHYAFDGYEVMVNEGEFIFIPSGAAYEYQSFGEERLYTSINFQATIENPRPTVYPFEIFHDAGYLTQGFSELWNFGDVSERFKCHSMLYDLLSSISRYEHISEQEYDGHRLIEPALEYLRLHIYDSGLRIDKLARLCGISDTYFRNIFVKKFNMTPSQYVLRERITQAKAIIESGDYAMISEVARSVGYTDPLYFSKAFKKFHGISPSEINK